MENEFHMTNYQIKKINEALYEIKKEQNDLSEVLQKNYAVIMKKLMKMQEFNQILDMTNQVFEKRLSNIEDILMKIYNKQ